MVQVELTQSELTQSELTALERARRSVQRSVALRHEANSLGGMNIQSSAEGG